MDAISAESIHNFIDSNKPQTIIANVKKILIRTATALQFVNSIKNDLPTKDDNKLTSAIKLVGLVSNLLARIPDKDQGAMTRISRAFNLREKCNPSFMDIVNDFNLLSEFNRIEIKQDEDSKSFMDQYGKVNLYSHPEIGVIGIRDSLSEVSSYMLHSVDFKADSIWKLVWQKADGCVDAQYAAQQFKTFRFTKYKVDQGYQFGSARDHIDKFIEKNRKFIAMGYDRSYLFLGPPGSGKSTMSQRFARAYSNKIIQFSPEAIWHVNDAEVIRLVQESGAEVILIDEIDKLIQNMNSQGHGQLLARFEKLRKCRPGLITIFTANSVKRFPDAMLRPGRIDDIIEFTYPAEEDRRHIIQGYAEVIGVQLEDEIISRIASISDGLTGAWLKEVVMQIKVTDPNAAYTLIEKMLRYAKARDED